MASWFTVYCTRSVRHLTVGDLTTALEIVDFATVAEGFGFEDEAFVEQAVSHLRVEPLTADSDTPFAVRY